MGGFILAAVLNGITLILIALYIFYEAIERFPIHLKLQQLGYLSFKKKNLNRSYTRKTVLSFIAYNGNNE